MKKILTLAAVLFLSLPAALLAEEILLEEYEITGNIEEINLEPAPASSPTKRNPKKATSYERPASRSSQQVGEVEVSIDKRVKIAPAFTAEPREGTFRVGLVGPGIYVGNKGIDTMMGIGAEGEYFIFERLSAGMKIQVATDFASNNELNSILSFIPQARYLFDFDSHPRWTAYVQAGGRDSPPRRQLCCRRYRHTRRRNMVAVQRKTFHWSRPFIAHTCQKFDGGGLFRRTGI